MNNCYCNHRTSHTGFSQMAKRKSLHWFVHRSLCPKAHEIEWKCRIFVCIEGSFIRLLIAAVRMDIGNWKKTQGLHPLMKQGSGCICMNSVDILLQHIQWHTYAELSNLLSVNEHGSHAREREREKVDADIRFVRSSFNVFNFTVIHSIIHYHSLTIYIM